MVRDIFNLPANPYHDKNEPTFLTIGDVVASFLVAAAITGGAYALVKHGEAILSNVMPSSNSAEVQETGAAVSQQPLAHRRLG